MRTQDTARRMAVFVGASSQEKPVATTLRMAQQLRTEVNPDLLLGGVAIPERHTRNGAEHLRLVAKQEAGCSYFVTQIVYDVNAAKNLVSDYAYECRDRGVDPVPIVFTVSVCGSMKTLEFLRWLGIDVPALDRERPAPRQRHSRRVRRACRGNRARADVLLPSPGRSVRHQHRIRFDPQAGDRGERAAGRPAWHHARALTRRHERNGRRAPLHSAQLAAQCRKQAEGALAAHGGGCRGSRVMRGFPDTHFSRGALSRRGSSSTGTGACASSTARRCRPGWRRGRRRLTRQRAR